MSDSGRNSGTTTLRACQPRTSRDSHHASIPGPFEGRPATTRARAAFGAGGITVVALTTREIRNGVRVGARTVA
jgi:hypothetical protein